MSQPDVQQKRAALQADPIRSQGWVEYIQALIDDGQRVEASKMLALALGKGLQGEAIQQLGQQLEAPGIAVPMPPATTAAATELNAQQESDRRTNAQAAQAELQLRQAVRQSPGLAAAHYNLGNLLKSQHRPTEAAACYKQALKLDPKLAEASYNLGNLLRDQAKYDEAISHYLKAIKGRPTLAQAHWNLGMAYESSGQPELAEASYQRTIELKPDFAKAFAKIAEFQQKRDEDLASLDNYLKAQSLDPGDHQVGINLGCVYRKLEQPEKAEAAFCDVLAGNPESLEALNNLISTLLGQNRLDEAEALCKRALSISSENAEAYVNLGDILHGRGQHAAAEACFHRALQIDPNTAETYITLGAILLELGRLDEAEAACRRSVDLKPNEGALSNLGTTFLHRGNLQEAERSYRSALVVNMKSSRAHSNLLFTLNYDPDRSAREIFEVYAAYDQQFAAPLRVQWRPHDNASANDRRLRIGYVSSDFNQHAVRHFLEPLLSRHDHARFETFAYAELTREDVATARYRSYCDHFILTRGMSDEALAQRIRENAIDVLIDVAGHTGSNRLLVFARKPAPVSLSWMGYGYTTGLKAIDYFLIDEASAPAGSEHLFSETPWRLPCAYAFRPDPGMGDVSPLPASSKGSVTFGTLSRAIRINHRTIRVWSEILKRVPGSVLVIDSRNFQHASMQEAMAERFAEHGIGREQLQIGCHSPPWDTLRAMDVALDCFPHNSGTTLFESLYMGVPFITLAGRPSVGRLGRTVLTGLGNKAWLDAWCSDSEEDYINKAVALASDVPALSRIRAELRPTMQHSALMDEAGFARNVEQAYEQMFARWQTAAMQQPQQEQA